ncbi:MAG TPA: enoyl-CoA hydratase/isomerase family protein [Gemmatimonadaceae bacterium]|nr:enoyl-CoA hydratase/isomerase family protein [Gemmatimonadaceae bacterium]
MNRVRVSRSDGVGRITLARPEKKNALDRQMADELVQALESVASEVETRVVLIDAEGDDFCAGADLEALESLVGADREAQLEDARALGRVFTTIRQLPVPVVAAVRGRALAGGAGLATACDLVLAHPEATFAYPEVRIGFVPAMVMTILRRIVPERQAFDLAITGRSVSAGEAEKLGLVSRVLADERFGVQVDEICRTISRSPREAVRRTKKLFYELEGRPFESGIAHGAQANAEARMTDEFREGVQRFLQRKRGGS